MKLLLDENLSEALLPRLPAQFVGSSHVRHLLAEGTIDRVIWDTAAAGGYAIVTLDSDFEAMSVIRGAPPKVILIAIHNPSNARIARLISNRVELMMRFASDPEAALLALRE